MRRTTCLLWIVLSVWSVCLGQRPASPLGSPKRSALPLRSSKNFYPAERLSSGLINDICQDQYGYMWIATENGLNKFDGYRFTTYLHNPDDSTSLGSNIVVKLYCDRKGQLWVGTRTGLSRYDYATNQFIHYPVCEGGARVTAIMERRNGEFLIGTSGRGLYTLVDNKIQKIPDGYTTPTGNWYFTQMIEDGQQRFWKCGNGEEVTMKDQTGVHQMNVKKGIVVKIADWGDEILIICLHGIYSYHQGVLSDAGIDLKALGSEKVVICCAFQDHEGNIYIGTRGDGLFLLKKGSRRLERVECRLRELDLNTAKVWAIGEDRHGNIWLGCQSKGLLMLSRSQPQFASWSLSGQGYHISSAITSVCEGDNGITWCTVQGNGVFGFDAEGRIVAHPAAPSPAEYIYRDKKGRYWMGTDNDFYAYHPLTGAAQWHATLEGDRLNAITEDSQGNLYISAFSRGFHLYNPESHEMRHYTSRITDEAKSALLNNWVMAMMPDSRGHIWLATSIGVSCFDPKSDSFLTYGWRGLLEGTMCYSLCETKAGDILIGTEQGIYRYQPGRKEAERFGESQGLADKVVGYIVQANDGDIWCSTSMGIWQYDIHKKKFIGHVNGNGLTTKEYINGIGMHTGSDEVCFANNDGLTVFRPTEAIGTHKELPAVQLTEFLIAGNVINTLTKSDGQQVAKGPAIETCDYTVSYLDNAISLEFSLLDFNNPENILFEYCINGGKWLQNEEGQNSIKLNHLQPGTYQIEVRALSAGTCSPSKTITVEVTPPWYRTSLAYACYGIGIVGLLLLLGWMQKRKADRRLDEEKMKFLINATHDIRSPLTLIMNPLQKLKNSKIEELKTTEELQSFNSSILQPSINTIERNAQRLMTLVNQILDERKIDKGQMELHCQETNIVDLIGGVCRLYQYEAQQRSISFTFDHELNNVPLWVDRMNFDKVVSNLLSNAFKYTSDGGDVKVRLAASEREVEMQVIDSGIGFKEGEPTRHLFERFHQGSNSVNLNMQGTGIGLNLCRSIVEMHSGHIKAGNRSDGQRGACFTVTIPTGNKHLKPEQIVKNERRSEILSTGTPHSHQNIRVMLVDDDQEIPDYIRFELGGYYRFTVCPNGKEALKQLLAGDKHYDIVVSDIMMPEMDGIQLLHRIKENPHTSDLPVILLTSKTEVNYRLEGLKKGADAYLAKPFDMEELHVQIDNLVGNVRRLRGVFSGASTQKDKVEDVEIKGNDEQLMERVMKSINQNLSDSDYNVETLARDVGLSRSQLHRKMKEMTGLSTGKFVRDLRMQQAGRLIREGRVNISQVAYSIGFCDQAHFATVFKTYYGMTPTEYAEKMKK